MSKYLNQSQWLLLINLIVSWYNVAVIWLMQVSIYPSWALVPTAKFGRFQGFHFWRLFTVVFPQAGLAVLGAMAMLRWRPPRIPAWAIWLGVVLQVTAWVLTGLFWGRWQGQIALPPTSGPVSEVGPANTALHHRLLATHWGRVMLITAYGVLMFWMATRSFLIGEWDVPVGKD